VGILECESRTGQILHRLQTALLRFNVYSMSLAVLLWCYVARLDPTMRCMIVEYNEVFGFGLGLKCVLDSLFYYPLMFELICLFSFFSR